MLDADQRLFWPDLTDGILLADSHWQTCSCFQLLVRFDAMYATLFKCSRKRIQDYPNLQGWLRDVYQFQTNPDGMQVCC